MILLDTHVLLWQDTDDPALGKAARRVLARAWKQGDIAVSAVSFWECALLYAKGRISLPKSPAAWRADMLTAGIAELPLSGDSAVLATELEGLHKDPADRFIAATAISQRATLMTADERLLKWKHALSRQDARK